MKKFFSTLLKVFGIGLVEGAELSLIASLHSSHDKTQETETALYRIKDGFRTFIIVILWALIKMEVIVKADGKPVSNKEKAMKTILHDAFGEDRNDTQQLLHDGLFRNSDEWRKKNFKKLMMQIEAERKKEKK